MAPGKNHVTAILTEIFKYVRIHPNFASQPVWCEKMFLCCFSLTHTHTHPIAPFLLKNAEFGYTRYEKLRAMFGWILTYLKISAEMAVTWFLPGAIHFLVTHPLGHRTCQMSWESWCGGWSQSGCFFLCERRLVAALPYSEGCPATWGGTGKREKGMKKWMKKIKIFIS